MSLAVSEQCLNKMISLFVTYLFVFATFQEVRGLISTALGFRSRYLSLFKYGLRKKKEVKSLIQDAINVGIYRMRFQASWKPYGYILISNLSWA